MSDTTKPAGVLSVMMRAQREAPALHDEIEEAMRAFAFLCSAAKLTRDYLQISDRHFGGDLLAKQINDALTRVGRAQ